jgi:hypothetical protein
MNTTQTVHVRWMVARDFPRVVRVEAETFGGWGEEEFIESLSHRNCIGMVAECGADILGFAVYELYPDEMVVVNLAAVTPGARAELIAKMRYKQHSHRRDVLVWDCEQD